jgi:hypothetical protein
MPYTNSGTYYPEQNHTPYERTELSDCTDCFETRCTEEDYCHECGEPLCEECSRVIEDMPLCTECCQTYVAERLQLAREKKARVDRVMKLHDETMAALEVYA